MMGKLISIGCFMSETAVFFPSPAAFRKWLEENHSEEDVLWVGYYKVATGKPSLRWEESVREALCFGWIDGLRKSIDEESYKIRFTPRREGSHWSMKNIGMAKELKEEGKMQPAGLKAFRKRDPDKTGQASYEQGLAKLKEEYREEIKSNSKAWSFFQELAPGYTRQSVHWVMSAKQEKTRRRRLRILIESCEKEEKIPPLQYGDK